MKEIILVCALLGQLSSVANCRFAGIKAQQAMPEQSPSPTRQTGGEWRAATYRGLTVGKSTSADMLRVLGKPHWSGPPGDQTEDDPDPEVWNEYEAGGDFPGKLTVVLDKRSGVILTIDLDPTNLSKKQAIEYFGDNYIVTRYAHDNCLGNGESAPVYESPDGPILDIEYRERGIAVSIGSGERVNTISYVKGPIGATSSQCKSAGNKT
jgi:hypothetical protein